MSRDDHTADVAASGAIVADVEAGSNDTERSRQAT